jgi:pyruvate dehydrogenase E2 component (dihydrolipoamide acetyltransferase)
MDEAYSVVALSPMRKIIAARMVEAKRTIPHFRLVTDIEVDALLELRKDLKERQPEHHLSLNDFLIKACAASLMEVPTINIQWAETGVRQYRSADISVVMAIEGGLATPIVRSANLKSIWDISRDVKDFATRAARNALKMDEVVGGSFSVSNLGMYGIEQFDAIINPPQCAILAIGSAKPRVIVSSDREMRIATIMTVTLAVDHRAIDGPAGASFLSVLRQKLEQPAHLCSGKEH